MVTLAKFWRQILNETKQPFCKNTSSNRRRLTSYCRYSKPLKIWKWRSTYTHFASLASAIPIRSFWKQTPYCQNPFCLL
nr:hypothetical protein CFP56_40294 [Quercus suber]